MRITGISNVSFKGVYLSNYLEPGKQRELGKQVRDLLNKSGMAAEYEKQNKDILIEKGPKNGVSIVLAKYDIKRILNDDYERWNGRF
ncbi:hypothetical protein IKQ26_02775 [bacterium]|nr:hypothetical protein [bacterium]